MAHAPRVELPRAAVSALPVPTGPERAVWMICVAPSGTAPEVVVTPPLDREVKRSGGGAAAPATGVGAGAVGVPAGVVGVLHAQERGFRLLFVG